MRNDQYIASTFAIKTTSKFVLLWHNIDNIGILIGWGEIKNLIRNISSYIMFINILWILSEVKGWKKLITYVVGDLLKSPARVLVNTVNTVGVI